jgi:hypothetical protein
MSRHCTTLRPRMHTTSMRQCQCCMLPQQPCRRRCLLHSRPLKQRQTATASMAVPLLSCLGPAQCHTLLRHPASCPTTDLQACPARHPSAHCTENCSRRVAPKQPLRWQMACFSRTATSIAAHPLLCQSRRCPRSFRQKVSMAACRYCAVTMIWACLHTMIRATTNVVSTETGLRKRGSRPEHLSRQTSDLAASPSRVCYPPPAEPAKKRRLSSGSWPVPAHWTVCPCTAMTHVSVQLLCMLKPIAHARGEPKLIPVDALQTLFLALGAVAAACRLLTLLVCYICTRCADAVCRCKVSSMHTAASAARSLMTMWPRCCDP